jgi:hypothetical protein
MKRSIIFHIRIYLMATVVMLCLENITYSADLLFKDDFESGTLERWDLSTEDSSVPRITSDVVHSGQYALFYPRDGADGSGKDYISCKVSVPVTEYTTLSAWVYPTDTSPHSDWKYAGSAIAFQLKDGKDKTSWIFLEWAGYGWLNGSIDGSNIFYGYYGWLEHRWNKLNENILQLALPLETIGMDVTTLTITEIQLWSHHSHGTPGEYYIDDIVLTEEMPCEPSLVATTQTLAITGAVYSQTKEVAEDGLLVEVNIITQNLTQTGTTGTAGKGQYSVTFFDMQKPVAKAGDEILVTVKDAQGKLVGQSRHTLTAAEVDAKMTVIDMTPSKAYDVKPVTLTLHKGINIISVPVKLEKGWRMSDLAEHIGKNNLSMIIRYDYTQDKFISYLPTFPKDSSANAVVQPSEGYIIVMKAEKKVELEEKSSDDETAAPSLMPFVLSSNGQSTSIFVITGNVKQEETGEALNEVAVNIRNLRTGQTVYDVTGTLAGYGNYVATFVALSEEFMTRTGDKLEITVHDANHRLTIAPVIHTLTPDEIADWTLVMPLRLSLPKQSALLQNYPNPFNPETWLPYQLAQDANVIISIYNTKGQLVRTLRPGLKNAGIYITKDKAAYWDGKDSLGQSVASGAYFYTLQVREAIPNIGAGEFRATRKMVIVK